MPRAFVEARVTFTRHESGAVHAPVHGLPGVDVFRAVYHNHEFARHSHEALSIGVVDGGVGEFWCRGANHRVGKDFLVLIQPNAVHTGRALDPASPLAYRMVYIDRETIGRILSVRDVPAFRDAAPYDARASRIFRAAFAVLTSHTVETLEREAALVRLLEVLLVQHGTRAHVSGATRRRSEEAVQSVRAFINEHFARSLRLSELSQEVGLSPHYLNSTFARTFGLPPHAYQLQLRVRRAIELLRGQDGLATIALSLGFADQSHFTRQFKRVVGVSPGAFRAPRRVVPASDS